MAVSAGEEIWRFQTEVSSSYEVAHAVAADADGNFFIAGLTGGNLPGFVNAGEEDFAVAKISGVDGSVLWSWQDGAAGDDSLSSAAATDDGGVVVGGHSNGTYNGVASEGLVDFVAIKLDADGTVEWIWQEGTVEDDFINSCSKTADGNVVLAGASLGEWLGTSSGEVNIVAVKLDVTDGSVLWRYQGDVPEDSVVAFASTARADGSVVLAGWTGGDWFGEAVGVNDFAAVALDGDGEELWRWQAGPLGVSSISGAAALPDGSVVLAGTTDGDFTGTDSNMGEKDFAVVKLTADGETEWIWQDGTEFDDTFQGVAAGIDGTSVVFAGWTRGSWAGTQAGDEDILNFAGMSLDADGNLLWRYQAGTTNHNELRDVAVRPTDGAALLVGWTHDEFVAGTTNAFSDAAGVLIKTGAVAPPPPSVTPAPGPSGACGATESFLVTSGDFPEIEGCFQATELSFSTGGDVEVWTVSGEILLEEVAIFGNADLGTGEREDSPYNVVFWREDEDARVVYCFSIEDSIAVHPADAAWECDLDGTGSFVPVTDASVSVSCGCSTPPAAPLPPAPAPTVDDGGVPLGAVIGGSVGGAAFLAIVGFLVVKRNRAKRDDKSFGAAPPGPVNYPVGPQGGRDGGASAGKGGAAPPPPPPAYAEPSPPHASAAHPGDDLPPPPAYSEPPAYSG